MTFNRHEYYVRHAGFQHTLAESGDAIVDVQVSDPHANPDGGDSQATGPKKQAHLSPAPCWLQNMGDRCDYCWRLAVSEDSCPALRARRSMLVSCDASMLSGLVIGDVGMSSEPYGNSLQKNALTITIIMGRTMSLRLQCRVSDNGFQFGQMSDVDNNKKDQETKRNGLEVRR